MNFKAELNHFVGTFDADKNQGGQFTELIDDADGQASGQNVADRNTSRPIFFLKMLIKKIMKQIFFPTFTLKSKIAVVNIGFAKLRGLGLI